MKNAPNDLVRLVLAEAVGLGIVLFVGSRLKLPIDALIIGGAGLGFIIAATASRKDWRVREQALIAFIGVFLLGWQLVRNFKLLW